MFFNPLTFVFIVVFFFFILFFLFLIQINIIALAFSKIGIPDQYVFAVLFATLFGSFVNIPIKKIPQAVMTSQSRVNLFGLRHVIPVWKERVTVLSVNLGGAVIPVLVSAYLVLKTGIWGSAVLATAFMTLVTHRLAKPVKGLGIALPPLLPPILAALISVLIAYHHAPVLAYISGTLGTLIGADILNLRKIADLGAPVASIGGAGTFDGIFLNGILAVMLSILLA